ncbi:uncharacterized protein LTR77_001604 [Saxophila tyrrhenica]|uniref:Uncharacterized protein n=1 Tax=Saxophila tyrrhenica TaxID=1690608 RepID=A0AAV9PLZ6_9PEZI|nr:hypothetical protein LTR77_001604 [Saxophila tyrrhenica]
MDASLRHTPGLIETDERTARIEKLRDELIKHYEALVTRAGIEHTDRNTTAITQYRMQVETAAIVRAAEDLQVLIRQMQEMWLFGQLDTLGGREAQKGADEKAREVAELLKEVVGRQEEGRGEGSDRMVNWGAAMVDA